MERYGREHEGVWSIPRDEAEFLHLLLLARKPKFILEVGTSIGYSGTWFALAAKNYGGRVATIEIDGEKVKMAGKNFISAGVQDAIELIPGDANSVLKNFGKKVGFLFLDGVKEEYLRHLKLIERRLPGGALVVADNAGDFAHAMSDYLRYVRTSGKYLSAFVPMGNGVEITYKF